DAWRANRDPARAREQRGIQERILTPLIAADPRNMPLKEKWVTLQRAYAGLALLSHDRPEAERRLGVARQGVVSMIDFEPRNQAWIGLRDGIDAELAYVRRAPQQEEAEK
ncbi:MAG: hypothetical protein ABI655_10960, partial [Phenylobacterium sp.]